MSDGAPWSEPGRPAVVGEVVASRQAGIPAQIRDAHGAWFRPASVGLPTAPGGQTPWTEIGSGATAACSTFSAPPQAPLPPSGAPMTVTDMQQAGGLYDPRYEHDACGVAL